MNLDKVIGICKKAKSFTVCPRNKAQWLGDGKAIFLVSDKPELTAEYLTALGKLSPEEVEQTKFVNKDLIGIIETADSTEDEVLIGAADYSINWDDGERVPLFTTRGIEFLKKEYLSPFGKDEYEIYERVALNAEQDELFLYFVVKVGMFVQAIILAQEEHCGLKEAEELMKLAKATKKTYDGKKAAIDKAFEEEE